jgi:hypothetical protein
MARKPEEGSSGEERRIIETWIQANPTAQARLTEVSDSDDFSWRSLRPHGVTSTGASFFIVNVADHDEMVRACAELLTLLTRPENLRVRRWTPSRTGIDRFRTWVWKNNRPFDGPRARVTGAGPHPKSGLLTISLSSVDRAYAEELEAASDGLAYVQPKPQRIIPLIAHIPR